ncbi:MAG: hypothetical protein WCK91_01980, partial [bacterium]
YASKAVCLLRPRKKKSPNGLPFLCAVEGSLSTYGRWCFSLELAPKNEKPFSSLRKQSSLLAPPAQKEKP